MIERASNDDKGAYNVGAVQRALRIIDFLAGRPRLAASLSEIAAGLSLPRPTVHRLLANLQQFGYVTHDSSRNVYQLGMRLMEYGQLVTAELSIVNVARPHIRRLMEETGETTHLAVLDGRHVVYIDKIEPNRAIRMVSRVGSRLPAHVTALGKAMLAQLDDDRVKALYDGVELERPTARGPRDYEDLRDRLQTIGARGYAVDDEEVEAGLRCVGAAVVIRAGNPIAAVSLSAPVERLPLDQLPRTGDLVRAAADGIASDLGATTAVA